MASRSSPRPSLVTKLEPILMMSRFAAAITEREQEFARQILINRLNQFSASLSGQRRQRKYRPLPVQTLDKVFNTCFLEFIRYLVCLVEHEPARLFIQCNIISA